VRCLVAGTDRAGDGEGQLRILRRSVFGGGQVAGIPCVTRLLLPGCPTKRDIVLNCGLNDRTAKIESIAIAMPLTSRRVTLRARSVDIKLECCESWFGFRAVGCRLRFLTNLSTVGRLKLRESLHPVSPNGRGRTNWIIYENSTVP